MHDIVDHGQVSMLIMSLRSKNLRESDGLNLDCSMLMRL